MAIAITAERRPRKTGGIIQDSPDGGMAVQIKRSC
jgi:hypothetical protein